MDTKRQVITPCGEYSRWANIQGGRTDSIGTSRPPSARKHFFRCLKGYALSMLENVWLAAGDIHGFYLPSRRTAAFGRCAVREASRENCLGRTDALSC